jgi:hypothetical protein
LNDLEYATSGNSIHHLYHLVKFSQETGIALAGLKTVVEIGGGYGSMARIFRKINPHGTYVIIDIPIFSYIQGVYLKTIYGDDEVHVVDARTGSIETGKINIVPLDAAFVTTLAKTVRADLLISTWALSESNKAMQELIKRLKYFHAQYLLLAYQKSDTHFVFAEDIQNVSEEYSKVFQAPTEYVANSFYLFCKRSR